MSATKMIQIKPATIDDAEVLSFIAKKTFLETFAESNTDENLKLYLKKTFSVEKQLTEIKDPHRTIEIAWVDNEPVGFLHIFNGKVDAAVKGDKPIQLLKLYLDSRYHGKGAGAALMDRCLEIARQNGFKTIWLGVWEHNLRAQNFYKKYGFKKVGEQIFDLGGDKQNDHIMSLKIIASI